LIKTVPVQRRAVSSAIATLAVSGFVAACGGGSDSTSATPTAGSAGPGVYDSQLAFDTTTYTTITVTLDGVATPVRWYREVCYVGRPMLGEFQKTRNAPGALYSVAARAA
jgi:hypothetical protein